MQDTHILDHTKVTSYPQSFVHDIFIDEDILDSAYYRSVISTLNAASEKDIVRIYIDTNGGFGSTAMSLTNVMDRCPAMKIGVLGANCKSAGTLIALHCNDWEVGAGCDWLAHTASFGVGGEAHKVAKQHEHDQKMIHKLLHREYEGFYTKEEIEDIANGNDSLLDDEGVIERLQKFKEYHLGKQASALEDSFLAQCDEEDKLVEEALNSLDITDEQRKVFSEVQEKLNNHFDEMNGFPTREIPEEVIEDLQTTLDETEEVLASFNAKEPVKFKDYKLKGCILRDYGSDVSIFINKRTYGLDDLCMLKSEMLQEICIAMEIPFKESNKDKTLLTKIRNKIKDLTKV